MKYEEDQYMKLYSKQALMLFSVLASPFFASFLMASNLKAVNNSKKNPIVIIYALVFTILVNGILLKIGAGTLNLVLVFGLNFLGGLVLNTFFWNEYLGSDLKFKPKSMQNPVLFYVGYLIIMTFIQYQFFQ